MQDRQHRDAISQKLHRQNRLSGGSHPGMQGFVVVESEIADPMAETGTDLVDRGGEAKSLQSVSSVYFDCRGRFVADKLKEIRNL